MMKPKVIAIVGPTASGKSELAIKIAKKFGGEIISADSRQVYKGLDISTGKISQREMNGAKHHLLDVISPKKIFTVTQYQKLARKKLQDILRRGKLPIICGGTGFYIDSLLSNTIFPTVPPNPKLREKLEKKSSNTLLAHLEKLDPERAAGIDRRNKRRLIRALEIVLTSGRPIPRLPDKGIKKTFNVLKIEPYLTKKELKKKIRLRLLKRLRQGMIAEVQKLHKKGLSWKRMEELGLEYRHLSYYLRGKIDKKKLLENLEKENWGYARRQITWFRKDKGIKLVHGEKEALRFVRKFLFGT